MHTAYIAIGSNMGDRASLIGLAVDRLRALPGVESVALSSLHETAPVGGPAGQDDYLNAAARLQTSLTAHELLECLLEIERGLGRVRDQRWSSRLIDLDLLLYDDAVIDEPGLTVPHPRMHQRKFVLWPLIEIGATALHPVLKKTASELFQEL